MMIFEILRKIRADLSPKPYGEPWRPVSVRLVRFFFKVLFGLYDFLKFIIPKSWHFIKKSVYYLLLRSYLLKFIFKYFPEMYRKFVFAVPAIFFLFKQYKWESICYFFYLIYRFLIWVRGCKRVYREFLELKRMRVDVPAFERDAYRRVKVIGRQLFPTLLSRIKTKQELVLFYEMLVDFLSLDNLALDTKSELGFSLHIYFTRLRIRLSRFGRDSLQVIFKLPAKLFLWLYLFLKPIFIPFYYIIPVLKLILKLIWTLGQSIFWGLLFINSKISQYYVIFAFMIYKNVPFADLIIFFPLRLVILFIAFYCLFTYDTCYRFLVFMTDHWLEFIVGTEFFPSFWSNTFISIVIFFLLAFLFPFIRIVAREEKHELLILAIIFLGVHFSFALALNAYVDGYSKIKLSHFFLRWVQELLDTGATNTIVVAPDEDVLLHDLAREKDNYEYWNFMNIVDLYAKNPRSIDSMFWLHGRDVFERRGYNAPQVSPLDRETKRWFNFRNFAPKFKKGQARKNNFYWKLYMGQLRKKRLFIDPTILPFLSRSTVAKQDLFKFVMSYENYLALFSQLLHYNVVERKNVHDFLLYGRRGKNIRRTLADKVDLGGVGGAIK